MSRSKSPSKNDNKHNSNGIIKSPNKKQLNNNNKTKKEEHHEAHFEFGGPIGVTAISILLPVTIYFLYFAANKDFSLKVYPFNEFNLAKIIEQPKWKNQMNMEDLMYAIAISIGWFAFLMILQVILPGEIADGTLLRNGKTLKYKINGHLSFWIVLAILFCGKPIYTENGMVIPGRFNLPYIYDHYLEFATASIILSTILSIYLYIKSFREGSLTAFGGNTGNMIYDWFIGRELNPREGNFDWKVFCELRPGLIGWVVINLACAVKQYELYGGVTYPMILINLFQGLYVWDALYQEKAILSTMDVTTDGLGFMLCFGDHAWVPFTYSLQARYLTEIQDPKMSSMFICFILALQIIGFVIFRGSNGEKDRFRRDPKDPSVAHLKVLETKSGSKLIISGWWGLARKINYTGDWIMGVSWCMCTGFNTPVTYFYAIYFAILLIHRALRDDEACARKYGEDWPKYKAAVPWVFFPGII